MSRIFAARRSFGDRAIGRVRREHGHRAAARRHRFGLGERDLVGRHGTGRRKAVEHAVSRLPRRLGRSVRPSAIPAIAAKRPAAPLRRAKAGAAPCRNRRARRRGCPRCCRHKARDRDRARAPRPCSARARSRSRARSGGAWRQKLRPLRGSRQPRHLHGQRRAAGENAAACCELERRAQQAPADRRRDGRGSACPRRRTARRKSADRHRRSAPATASGLRWWHRRAAAGRRDRPRGSRIRGPCRAAPDRARRSSTQRQPDQRDAATRRSAATSEAQLSSRHRGSEARSDCSHALRAGLPREPVVGPALRRTWPPTQIISRRDFDALGRGAAETVGPVHVFDARLRAHVFAGRDRAHDIGDGEYRRIVASCARTPR